MIEVVIMYNQEKKTNGNGFRGKFRVAKWLSLFDLLHATSINLFLRSDSLIRQTSEEFDNFVT